MKTKKILFYLLCAILGGCVPIMSLHPLYTDKDLVFEEKLLGTWLENPNEPNSFWKFSKLPSQENTYELILSEEKINKGSFEVKLIKLQNDFFLDFFPNKFPCGEENNEKTEWAFDAVFTIPVHTFAKVEAFEPNLIIKLTDDDEMEKFLKDDPNAVKHETIDNRPVLTASTEELQKFAIKYAGDDRVFSNEIVLKRKPEKTPDIPASEQKPKESEE